jgi:hypothetical protein
MVAVGGIDRFDHPWPMNGNVHWPSWIGHSPSKVWARPAIGGNDKNWPTFSSFSFMLRSQSSEPIQGAADVAKDERPHSRLHLNIDMPTRKLDLNVFIGFNANRNRSRRTNT